MSSVVGSGDSYEDLINKSLPVENVVDHPTHYNSGNIEVIDYIVDQGWAEGFCLGNAIKYISRSAHKGKQIEDLNKAIWYLRFYVGYLTNSGVEDG